MARIVDVHTFFGSLADRSIDVSLETLRGELAGHAVTDALTWSLSSVHYSDAGGNDETLAACAASGRTRLYPIGTVNPVASAHPDRGLDACLDHGCRAVAVFPDAQHWSIGSLPFRELLARLTGRGIPLVARAPAWGVASQLAELSQRYDVPVVLLGAHYTQVAEFAAVLRYYPNVYTDTHRMALPGDFELLASEVGSSRLLFGSGAPLRPLQCALNAVLCARISDDDKRAILAENAVRLFGLPGAPEDSRKELPEPKLAAGLVDVHGHTGEFGYPIPFGDDRVSELVARYQSPYCVVSSLRAIADDLREGNREQAEALARQGNLRGYVVVNPNYLSESCEEMDRYYPNPRFVGAKIHCQYSRKDTATPEIAALLHEVARRGKPVKIHNDGPGWEQALIDACRCDPDLTVIVAHGGLGQPSLEGARAVAETDNVYLEFASSFPELPIVREVARRVSPERILFGTDVPLLNPAFVFGTYYDAGLLTPASCAAMIRSSRKLFGD